MTNIIKHNASDIIQDNMMAYSATVLLNRAIPDIRDGLKPSYRNILFSMYRNKTFTYTKSRSIDGEIAKIHEHGSAYKTMVGMAQNDRHNQVLLDGDGNWGKYTAKDLPAAADRYTNAKLSDWSRFLFRDIEKGLVPFKDNYDGTIKIPTVLPVPFPLILTMAQSGIGVGFSSKTPSYNINEVADIIIEYLNSGEVGVLVPDFPTGGIILQDDNIIENINKNGSGSVKIRGKADIDGLNISISEIPYGVTREQIIDRVVTLAKTDKLSEVRDIQDLSGKNKFEIFIKAKRGTNMEVLLEKLYKFTPLESNYGVNSMVLVDGLPKQLGASDIVKVWTQWRLGCIKTDIDNQIIKLTEDIELCNSYKLIRKSIKEFIETVRYSDSIIEDLINEFGFTELQAKHVHNMQLRNINESFLDKKIDELRELQEKKDNLEKLGIEDYKQSLIKDMEYVKKHFGHKRKSSILDINTLKADIEDIQKEIKYELVDDSDYWITITEQNFIYKTKRKKDKITLAPQDKIKYQYKLNNKEDEIFAYTKSRNGVKEQIRNIPISKSGDFGVKLDVNNKDVVDLCAVTKKYKYIILLLTEGRIVKFSPESYRPGTNVFRPTHTDVYDITDVILLEEDSELELIDSNNNKNILHTKDIRTTQSRTGTGQFIHSSRRKNIKKYKIIS